MDRSKTVNFTMKLAVPEWANWLAMDGSGCVWAFENKPEPRDTWWDNQIGGKSLMIAEANWWYVDTAVVDDDLYVEWRDTLVEVRK